MPRSTFLLPDPPSVYNVGQPRPIPLAAQAQQRTWARARRRSAKPPRSQLASRHAVSRRQASNRNAVPAVPTVPIQTAQRGLAAMYVLTRSELTTGCHLNLCHICAPALIHRAKPPPVQEEAAPASSPEPDDARLPWHAVLARATRNNPKARRLSMGGHRHCEGPASPTSVAGEINGDDLCREQPDGSGRIAPIPSIAPLPAKCLICRSGVQGWLRVYT